MHFLFSVEELENQVVSTSHDLERLKEFETTVDILTKRIMDG